MQIIRDSSGLVSNWISEELGQPMRDGSMAFGFIDKDGNLVGGLAFHDVKADSMGVAIASRSPRWCTPGNLKAMFTDAFDTLDKHYLYTLTPAKNERAAKLAEGMGFSAEGHLKGAYNRGEDDLIIFGMRREDCPFIDEARMPHHG